MKRKINQPSWIKAKLILLTGVVLFLVAINIGFSYSKQPEPTQQFSYLPSRQIVNDSVDQKTGLIIAPGFAVVSTTCVRCHSPKLITEKRATREGWLATIRWMQQTQGLWDLGSQEPVVLDYLAKNYAPKNQGRRPLLQVTEWYKLNN